MGLVHDEKPAPKEFRHHVVPRATVRQQHTELPVIPGSVVIHPVPTGNLSLLQLLLPLLQHAVLHARPGQVNREVVLWLVAPQTVYNVSTGRP